MNAADTAFMLICTALVFLMVPGLALFYGGLVQSRNILSTTMHSFILLGIGSVVWVAIGFSLAFGPDNFGLIGNFDHILFSGVSVEPQEGSTIPFMLFAIFQCMFACLTPALISGAYAERIKFSAMVTFSTVWLIIVYCPLAHWVWGNGWLAQLGALDFAGGAVVHMSSAAAALAAVHVLGARSSVTSGVEAPPHNLPFTIFGAGLLWFGWFGFNAGSALEANGLAVNAFATTQLATAAAMLGWLFVERFHSGKPTTFGAASGALAGLVAITPAAGFVTPASSLLIGFIGGIVCYGGVLLKQRLKYDDALDVVGIHGIGGTWGALATGFFATTTVNAGGSNGFFYGNPNQVGIQIISIIATWVFSYVVSRIIFTIIKGFSVIRATEVEENIGLDLAEHNERGYQL